MPEADINNNNILDEQIVGSGRTIHVDIFDTYWQFYDAIMGGYSLDELSNRSMPNGLNEFQWRRWTSMNGVFQEHPDWLGVRDGETFDSVWQRKEFTLMADFRDKYENVIEPLLKNLSAELLKSKAELVEKKLVYNDLELGTFSFDRAAISLVPLFVYFDLSIEEEVSVQNVYDDDGVKKSKLTKNIVYWIPKYNDTEKSVRACKKIQEGENIYAIMNTEGLKPKKFTSNVKKSFVYKYEMPKPKKAVRIFVNLMAGGGYTSESLKWTGYAGVAIAKYLEANGFAVSLHGNFGWDEGEGQVYSFTAKELGKVSSYSNLLYMLSDPTILRLKGHAYHVLKTSRLNNRNVTYRILFPQNDIFFSVCKTYGVYDNLWKSTINRFSHRDTKNFLYINLPLAFDENAMINSVRTAIMDVINLNYQAVLEAKTVLRQ